MSHIARLNVDEWEEVARQAISKLPPQAMNELLSDSGLEQKEVCSLAWFAWGHFQILQWYQDGNVSRQAKEIVEVRDAIEMVDARIADHMRLLAKLQEMAPWMYDNEVKLFNTARLALHKLKADDGRMKDGWEKLRPQGITSHDPTLEKYLHDLMLTYSRLTQIAPSNLKLSSTKGPRTYLMNFLISMTEPIPRFAELEEGRLAKRLHHRARQIINGPFKNLPKLPMQFSS